MKMVALLRGINVGGNRKVPMPKLIEIVKNAGFTEVQTYINSGNLVFEVKKIKPELVALKLEKVIENEFKFKVDVIVRTKAQWKKYSVCSPFPAAESIRPNMLHLGLAKNPLNENIAQSLDEKARNGEKIKVIGDAIWIDFAKSVGNSKLSPVALDKAAGSSVTMRNWNTVLKLDRMLDE